MSALLTTWRLFTMRRYANIAFLSVTPLILLLVWPSDGPVTPLLPGELAEMRRLEALERKLQQEPGNVWIATEVGRLWHSVGQTPWSYTALVEAERKGPTDGETRLRLAAAYLDIGELDDSRRALADARKACQRSPCADPVSVKVSLFTRLTDNLVRDGINPRQDLAFTERTFRKLLREMSGKPPSPPATK